MVRKMLVGIAASALAVGGVTTLGAATASADGIGYTCTTTIKNNGHEADGVCGVKKYRITARTYSGQSLTGSAAAYPHPSVIKTTGTINPSTIGSQIIL